MFGLESLSGLAGNGISPLGNLGSAAGNGFSGILGALGFGGSNAGYGGYPQQGYGNGYGIGAPNLPPQQANAQNAGILAAGATGVAGLAGFAGAGQFGGTNNIPGGLTLPPQQGFGGLQQSSAPGGIIPLILTPITNLFTVIKSLIFIKQTIRETKAPDTSNIQTSYDQYSDYMYDLRNGEFDEPDEPQITSFGPDSDASKGFF